MMGTSGKTRIVVAGIWVSVFVVILFTNFSNVVSNQALKSNQELLQELSVRSAGVLRDKIILDTKLLTGIADNIHEQSALVSPQTFSLLKAMSKQTDFERILIITANGKAFLNENEKMNIEEEAIIQRVFNGEIIVTGSFYSKIDQKTANAILVPIYDHQEQVIGILCGIHNIEKWSNLLDYSFGYNKVYFHVLSGDGNSVLRSKVENNMERQETIHDFLSHANFLDDFSHEKIHKEMERGNSGFATIEVPINGGKSATNYLSYAPVGINGWYVFALIPEEIINNRSDLVKDLGRELLFKVVALFFVLIVYITIEMSKTTRAIALSKERYRIAVEQADTIIFDYDIRTDMMYNSAQLNKNFRMTSAHSLYLYDICHPDDAAGLKDFIKTFVEKKQEMEIECRFDYKDYTYKWNKFSLIPIFDSRQNLLDAIGILEDITELKATEEKLLQAEKHSKVLKKKAERDYLTDLYNKGTAEYLISSILQDDPEHMHAFIIIDLDNFKAINDNFGHATGDEVLRKVAVCLQELFRATDIISRIGGDEFVVLLRNPTKMEIVLCKLQEICDRLIFVYTKDGQDYKVSASVGCSIYPQHGKNATTLYEKADEALYVAKRNKKGTFSINSSK